MSTSIVKRQLPISSIAEALPINGGFDESNQDQYVTPGITTVFARATITGASNAWYTLIVTGSQTSHLEQILLSNLRICKRYYEAGSWSSWTIKTFS